MASKNSFKLLPTKAFVAFSRFRRGFTLGVRAAALDDRGRVFLVKHSYTPGWYLPGGGVEPGETTEEAMARELLEEGGIAVAGTPELFGLYLNRIISRRDHVAFFVCRDWSQARTPDVPNMEIVDCGFFPLDALPEGATDATRRRIAELGGAARSPDW
jgi:8-oxo-dGTP pyrophosphatase MutT (NUDIX family)